MRVNATQSAAIDSAVLALEIANPTAKVVFWNLNTGTYSFKVFAPVADVVCPEVPGLVKKSQNSTDGHKNTVVKFR